MIQCCGAHLKRGIPEENPIRRGFLACELRSRPARLDSIPANFLFMQFCHVKPRGALTRAVPMDTADKPRNVLREPRRPEHAARGKLPAYVVAPQDAPETCIKQAGLYGAEVALIPGLISDAGRVAADVAQQRGWFNVATLREPYRAEGKKTMGLELAEQLGWRLPDAIIYPAGGGTGIVGMWKAFAELRILGWLKDTRMPKMIIVQAEGCAPLVRAFQDGMDEAGAWPAQEAHTQAAGLRVPSAIGDRLILQAVRESDGIALAVSDESMTAMVHFAAQREGMLISLEAAATIAAYHALINTHFLEPGNQTVLFFTGSGLADIGKYS